MWAWPACFLAVFVLGILLRTINLGADPMYAPWIGYIVDEGRWIAHARSLALFGDLYGAEWMLHLLLAPLYQALAFLTFSLAGTGIVPARLVTVAFGCGLLVLFWLALRRRLPPEAVLAGVAWLAFQPDLLVHSRLAIPEVPALFLLLATYFVLMAGVFTERRAWWAGVVGCGAVAMKATALPALAALALIAALRAHDAGGRPARALAAFATAPVVCGIVALGAAAYVDAGALWANLRVVASFVEIQQPAVMPFELTRDALLALYPAVWVGLLGWATRDATANRWLERLYLTSALWLAVYAIQAIVLAYYPDRYVIHAHGAAAINMAAGVALMRLDRLSSIGLPARVACVGLPMTLLGPYLHARDLLMLTVLMVALWTAAGARRTRPAAGRASAAPAGARIRGLLIGVAVMALAALSVRDAMAHHLHPTYTIREASLELERLVADAPLVGASGGESLFTATRVRYRSILGWTWNRCTPPVLLISGPFDDPKGRLERDHELIWQYQLAVSPEFREPPEFRGQTFRELRVYRRRPDASPDNDDDCVSQAGARRAP